MAANMNAAMEAAGSALAKGLGVRADGCAAYSRGLGKPARAAPLGAFGLVAWLVLSAICRQFGTVVEASAKVTHAR